jgi:hypothetical protein
LSILIQLAMDSRQKLLLSPLDQHAPKVYTRMALVFPVTDYEQAITTLQTALRKTCEQLPYLKGTVVEGGLSHRKQSYIIVDPSNAAPQFIEQPAPNGLPTYAQLKTNRTPFPPETFPSPMIPGGPADAEVPVLGASYTKIEGGLVMCIATYHKVVDGGGYSEILRLLAAHSRSNAAEPIEHGTGPDPEEISSRRQRILKGKVDVSDELKKLDFEAMLARHPEYMLKTKMSSNAPDTSTKTDAGFVFSGKNTNQVFAFSGQKIEAVRAALSDKLPSSYLTVNNILTAIIWPSITHIRATRPKGALSVASSKMDFSVSGRRLVGDSLQEPPFTGNVIGYAQTELGVSKLSFQPSLDAAEKLLPVINLIAGASENLNASTIESLVHLSDQNPDLSNITMSWLLNGPGDMHFISWAQQACFELDFGETLGHPGYMRSAFIKLDGVVTFLPRRRTEGCVDDMDVSVLLREDDMERLNKDPVWNSWLID